MQNARDQRARWRRMRRWFTVGIVVAAIAAASGMASAPTALAQAFEPRPPADPPSARETVCRPAAPAITKTSGASVRVDRGPTECNAVALTFDAGADRGYTELILDILRDEQVPASFGITGIWAQQNPDLVQRIAEDGHEFINHTWAHASFTGFSPRTRPLSVAERRLDLDQTEEVLVSLTGKSTRPYFRPPYGDLDAGVLKDVADAGYDYTIMWTVDSHGWMHGVSAEEIVDRCLSLAEPGSIYIFHVGGQSEDALALPAIVAGLREQGYHLVTVSDLLGL